MGKGSETAKYEQHPLAVQYAPGTMADEEFEALCDDLKQNKQREKIVLFEKKILDGMHRYRGCMRNGQTPLFMDFEGTEDEAIGLVISLNIMRRRLGPMQRAMAGARLNMHHGFTQDKAALRVGVSKVHISLVAQALKSNNARVIKMLENPDLTRERLHDELVDCGIIMGSASRPTVAPTISAAGASNGLEAVFAGMKSKGENEGGNVDDDELFGDAAGGAEGDAPELDAILGTPPSAGGKVISFKPTSEGGNPIVGTKPGHPERRPKETPAHLLATQFRAMTEAEQISFMQLTWYVQRKLIKAAGLSPDSPTPVETKLTPGSAAKVASDAVGKAAATSAAATAPKGPRSPRNKGTKAAA